MDDTWLMLATRWLAHDITRAIIADPTLSGVASSMFISSPCAPNLGMPESAGLLNGTFGTFRVTSTGDDTVWSPTLGARPRLNRGKHHENEALLFNNACNLMLKCAPISAK